MMKSTGKVGILEIIMQPSKTINKQHDKALHPTAYKSPRQLSRRDSTISTCGCLRAIRH